MKVLFQCRSNLFTLSGGDKIQILETKEALEKKNIEIAISTTNQPDLTGIDIFHLFNPSLGSLKPLRECRKKNIPIAISTIHWDMKEYYESILKINHEYFRLKPKQYLQNYLRNQFFGLFYNYFWYPKNMRDIKKILELGDVLLPNSQAETDLIDKQFHLGSRCQAIINGIQMDDPIDKKSFYNKYKIKDFILCTGRLEYRKNQFLLIKSLLDNNIPLVFIGNSNFNSGYTNLCKKLADKRKNVYFIDHLKQKELFSAYANAKVHALVSWYETPGLANLEAGYFGCNLAISDKGSTKEYFKNYAEYCDPDNLESIKKAVINAYNKPKNAELTKHIQNNYTWKKTAEQTLSAYYLLLEKKR